jgi:hypothetical protein
MAAVIPETSKTAEIRPTSAICSADSTVCLETCNARIQPPQCWVGRLMQQTCTSLRHSPLFEPTLLDTHSQVAAAEVGNVNHSH